MGRYQRDLPRTHQSITPLSCKGSSQTGRVRGSSHYIQYYIQYIALTLYTLCMLRFVHTTLMQFLLHKLNGYISQYNIHIVNTCIYCTQCIYFLNRALTVLTVGILYDCITFRTHPKYFTVCTQYILKKNEKQQQHASHPFSHWKFDVIYLE